MSKDKLIPELRFPDFENFGEWVEDDIGTLFKFKQGVQVPVSNQFPEQGDDMVRFIRIIDITSNNEPPRYIQHPGDSHIISKDDLFMIRYGTPGLISIGFEGVIANNLFRLIWKSEKRNQPKFWFYAFQRLESFIYNLSSSSSMPAISFSTLEGLKIGFPPTIEEQQKIASCLSSLDELLAAHNDKLDALKDHKKGLLQNLFPQEGETVPKVRFPEFEGDGEWEETTLEQVADYENGKAHEKDIDENGDYIVVNSKFISTEGETVKYSDTAFCPANLGDILMVLSDVPNGKAIAKCFYVDEENRYSVNQRICRITATDCDSRFLFYIMDRNAYFLSFDDGVKQTNLRKSDVLEFPFRIPADSFEQTKIASCISAVDELIKSQSAKIEELNQHKRGLMQGLFPKMTD